MISKFIIDYISNRIELSKNARYYEDIFKYLMYDCDDLHISFEWRDLTASYSQKDILYQYNKALNIIKNTNPEIFGLVDKMIIYKNINFRLEINYHDNLSISRKIKLKRILN